MSPLTLNPEHQRHPRSGFSLIELMAVIAIIGILLAILLPALGRVRGTVRVTEIANEIKAFEQGIAEFKLQFGMEPPSRITIWETDTDWDTQSRTLIRQMWPQFDFSDVDRNGDSDVTDSVTLTGDECLLFFLGGSDTVAPAGQAKADGFSSNPANPFATGGNRVGPFGEFDPDRMIDVDGDGAHAINDLYVDTVVPYLYLSSYDGRSYRPTTDGDLDQDSTYDATTEIENVYLQKADDTSTAGVNEQVAWKDKSFQIICAGGDGEFGVGGLWSSENGFSGNAGDTSKDRDNITNFSGGTLE
ncbi:MAG: prepilin-type N-terminal cleavage/methylation domain-containing protein [Planctomycetaceae bacterium]|nr:prepilin-type N-terminal cleavage/methylation domain-containing protein [Planctomycetaceae bacterium]